MKRTLSTRNQLQRLISIHELLSTGLHYSLDDLINECAAKLGAEYKPGRRTLYMDLERLRDEFNAPIAPRNRNRKPYWYTRTDFSLYGVLNKADAALANEAAALLKQVSYLPHFAGLEDVFLKFEQRVGTMQKAKRPSVLFEQNPDYAGLKWLTPIYDAMAQDRQVWLTYKPFGREAFPVSFSPYLLKEYTNRWHVYGYGAESAGLNSLALDRIESLKIRPDLVRQANETNWDEYLKDVIGFTRLHERPVEIWLLRVYKPRAYYVKTKPLHGSQVDVCETDQYIDFQYRLRWNRELDSRIFELGPDAELLEPADKRAEFAEKVKRLMERYG